MRVIYEAFDGTQFDEQMDCEFYEFDKLVLDRTKIRVFDRQRHLLKRLNFGANYETYGNEYRVEIKTEKDLDDIEKVSEFTGLYDDINSIGTWIYDEEPKDGSWPGWRLRKK